MLLNHKIVLGSVQFGLPYGINNIQGQTSKEEAFRILDRALLNGIKTIDTAPAYGSAMELLAEYCQSNQKVEIYSKFHGHSEEEILHSIEKQLKLLKRESIKLLSYHNFNDWNNYPLSLKVLQKLKSENVINKIGISLYTIEEFERAIEADVFDVIQIPYNLLDNYSIKGEMILKAKTKELEIHTRSAFLQGLFFKEIEKLSSYFYSLKPSLIKVKEMCADNDVSITDLALQYCVRNASIDKVLIGVETEAQLIDNISALSSKVPEEMFREINKIKLEAVNLLNPVNWPK